MLQRTLLSAALLAALAWGTPARAGTHRVIDDNDTVVLRGNVHHQARPEFDRGATDPELPMERMLLSLKRSPDQQALLERLLSEQQDPASANYRQWLTPEDFAGRFGPKPEDIAAVTGWLSSHGFTVQEVSRGGGSITFSGKASRVERAFRTPLRDYLVEGRLRHANSRDPELPRGLADLVAGVVSLHSFPRPAMNSGTRPLASGLQPEYTSGGSHYLSPADFATIYNLGPLYAQGIDGSGQTIAIVGRTHPASSNWTAFRSTMGLTVNTPQVILNGADPGDLGANEDGEADLDVEWSGAVAKNASVTLVVSASTFATDGVDLSAQYIVANNLAPVMSTSFGLCENLMGATELAFYNSLWQQAAAQGISSFVSSGDSGAAGCSASDASSGSGLGVNGLGSTPYNIAVGGTQFSDGAGGYWSSQNTGYSSALSYIPETVWNESGSVSGGKQLWATGGGASLYYAKPFWQAAPGVPAASLRYVPDVSLTAAAHDGYLVQTQGALYSMGGTSASSPAFAGLMALIVQKTGQRQGNANPRLYQLASEQFAGGGAAVFHDITSGNNSVPGVAGYSGAAGYDQATGLGSVDAYALASNWALPVAPLSITSTNSLANATLGVPFSALLSATGGVAPYSWTLSAGSLDPGLSLAGSSGLLSGTPGAAGVFSFTVQVTDALGSSALRSFSHATESSVCANWPVRLAGSSPTLYPDFSAAYGLAAGGDVVQLQALNFNFDLVFDRNLSLALRGGFDCGYSGNAASTVMLGKLRVANGTLKLENLKFQ